MPINIPPRYPLDPTGVSPNNLIVDEPHVIDNKKFRVIVPANGAYFDDENTLKVFDTLRQVPLYKGIDYLCTDIASVPTSKYNKTICDTITIKNRDVSNNIMITYQCLGGTESTRYDVIEGIIEVLKLDERPVNYSNLTQLPDVFPGAPDYHDIGNGYGFEYLVSAIDRLNKTFLLGNYVREKSLLDYIDKAIQNPRQTNRAYQSFMREGGF